MLIIHFDAERYSTEVSSTVRGGAIEPSLDSFTHFCLHCLTAVMECFEHLHMVQIL